MAARSVQTRRQRAIERKAARKQLMYSPVLMQDNAPAYVSSQVARVRVQIERLAALLDKAQDPLDIDRLARALSVLRKDERVLDGRPEPGSRRPGKERNTQDADVNPV